MKFRNLLLAVFLAWVIVLVIIGCSSGSGGDNKITIQTQKTLQTSNLINGIISIQPGSYYDQRFTVSGSMADVTVTGSFNASAGLGDNIEVYIFNELAFTNWSSGSTPPSGVFYSSGRIKTDNLNVHLGSGSYHLVLNNKYSLVSTKQVVTNINLNCYQ